MTCPLSNARPIASTQYPRPPLQLRRSHNRDLIDSVCTDVAELQNKKLNYFRGNYNDYQIQKQRGDLTKTRLAESVNNKREKIIKSMDKSLQLYEPSPILNMSVKEER